MKFKSLLYTAMLSVMAVLTVGCGDDENDNMLPDGGNKPDVPVEQVMVMKDGFMASDGLDEASGRYRLTIALCDQKIGEQTFPYTDVLIYVYMKEPLKKLDEHHLAVPFGRITPFHTDGQPIGDMVYYIGQHHTTSEGDSFEGTAWVYNESKEKAQYFVASDLDKTDIRIDDLGNGSYEVHGTLYDKELNKELKFSYKDSKPVYALVGE